MLCIMAQISIALSRSISLFDSIVTVLLSIPLSGTFSSNRPSAQTKQ